MKVPGKYSIVRASVQPDSDGFEYTDLSFGYETLEEAKVDLEKVSKDNEVALEELCIIKICHTPL